MSTSSASTMANHVEAVPEPAPVMRKSDKKVIWYSLIIALAACAFGFDISETGGFLAMPIFHRDFGTYDAATGGTLISAQHQTLMYGVELAFVFGGTVSTGFVSVYYGRKVGLYICAILSIVGAAIQMISAYSALVVGRAVMGLSIGFAAANSVAYWSEITPAPLRGMVVIFWQLFLNIANFIGSCIDQGTHNYPNAWAYRIPLLTMMGPPLMIIVLVWIIPESPRWLVAHEKNEKAHENLKIIRGSSYTAEEVETEIKNVIAFNALEKELDNSTSYLECFKGTDLRRTFIATLMMVGQQFMGVAFLAGYMTYFFALVGFTDAFVVTVIATAVSIAGTFAAFPIVRYFGRRPTMIIGATICGFCMLGFATVAEAAPGSSAAAKCIIAFICIFSFAYSATWGSIGPIVVGEVPSNRLRSKTIAVAVGVAWLVSLLVVCTIPYLISPQYANLGTKVGFLFGALTVVALVLTILFLPETKDRTLEEIDEMFINRVATRAFKNYVCTHQVAGFDLDKNIEKLAVAHTEEVSLESRA